jgi:pyrroloquinoline quinone (PQQ) biosynthesis protein C
MSRKQSFYASRIAKWNRNFGNGDATRKTENWWKNRQEEENRHASENRSFRCTKNTGNQALRSKTNGETAAMRFKKESFTRKNRGEAETLNKISSP